MQTKNDIERYAKSGALIEVDPSASPPRAMRIVIVIDPEAEPSGRVWVETRYPASVTGTPAREWHNLRYALDLPEAVDATRLHDAIDELGHLVDTVVRGHSSHWNGNNRVGSLDANATEALDELESAFQDLPSRDGGLWQAGDWLAMARPQDILDELGLDAESDSDAISAAADRLDDQARDEGAYLTGTREWLVSALDRLREEQRVPATCASGEYTGEHCGNASDCRVRFVAPQHQGTAKTLGNWNGLDSVGHWCLTCVEAHADDPWVENLETA